ncbi:MAG TPA: SIS domain-containing protein [Kofleriaceae bacterium]|jgi:glucosamine--fructose-6-phosphate aminotransferase (isomerizing)|nr:SIS domain-containing protein [Kofleriaceae bacterium]
MTHLADEAAEAADGARRQLERCGPVFAELGRRLRANPPRLVVTCARGSSDHAATYGKYVVETAARTVVASVGPSVASMYHRAPQGLDGALFVAVSQSGRSPDLVELTEAARKAGALVVGFINVETSPLASACDLVIPICAGEERAVAATKSFLLSSFAFLQLAAHWTDDAVLRDTIANAPDAFASAAGNPWQLTQLATAESLYVVGRGVGLGPAHEVALKLKETCRLHAEAFSTAEVLHGPLALVRPGFPVVAITQDDLTAPSTKSVLDRLSALGATCYSNVVHERAHLDPLCQVLSFYMGLPALAAARGLDADLPAHLRKVTETL